MAGYTFTAIHGRMLDRGGFDRFVDLGSGLQMTGGAKFAAFFFQHILGLGAVGIVAIATIIQGRSMYKLHVEIGFAVIVAIKTEGASRSGGDEQLGIWRRMRAMAGNAVTFGHRPMLVFFFEDRRLMASVTEGADRITLALQLIAHL